MGDVRARIYVLSQVYSGSSGLAGGDSPRHYFFLLFSFFVFDRFLLSFFVEGESILLSVGKILVDGSLRFFFSSRDGTVLFAPPTNCFYRGLAGYLWKSDQGVRGFDKFSSGCRLGLDLIFFRNMRITTCTVSFWVFKIYFKLLVCYFAIYLLENVLQISWT